MTEPTLDTLTLAIRVPLRILTVILLLAGCATTTPQYAAERAYGTYWGFMAVFPGPPERRLIYVTPTDVACDVLRTIYSRSVLEAKFDSRCQVMALVPGTTSMAVSSPPHQMALAYQQTGYMIAPTAEACAELLNGIPPCFLVSVRYGAALGR